MKSTGTCYLCRETYSRQGMARHVRACRGNADLFDPDETGDVRPSDAGREYFHIVAEGRDWPAYWLHVAVPTDAPLYALDRFLRDIWLECCGHLSSFVINGVKYTSFEDDGYGPYAETRSMEARCGDILSEGTRFSYDYDFGTTTRLSLRVLGAFTFPVAVKRGIYVLARNHQPVIPCEKCGAPSRHVCGTCLWGDEGWLCDACARTHDCGPDALLPVVNSPRVGRCAYTGELMDDDDPFDAGGDGDDEVGEDEVAASSLAGMLAHADPFASERALRRVYREMTGKEFDTIEEVNVFLQALVEREDFDEPDDDPISRAQELAWQAYQADPTTGRKLAREALSIDPDCADAYVVLGNLAEDVKGAIEEYEKGVAAGERAIKRELGEDAFQTEAGHFWGIVATRPYMRARENLAVALWADGQRDEAIQHLQDMLRLNPDDNQGVRYSLVNRLLELGRTAEAGRLLARYSEDSSCEWLYSKALWHYQQSGDSSSSRRALESAIDANPYVALMLDEIAHEVMAGKSSDDIRPDTPYYSPGSPEEAMLYAFDAFGAWVESGDAILWLMETVQRFAGEIGGPRRVEKIGRNDPCPCGSGKKYKKCCGR